jgi:hypothetical protein
MDIRFVFNAAHFFKINLSSYQRAINRPGFMFLEGTTADTTAGLSDEKNSHKKAGDIYN